MVFWISKSCPLYGVPQYVQAVHFMVSLIIYKMSNLWCSWLSAGCPIVVSLNIYKLSTLWYP